MKEIISSLGYNLAQGLLSLIRERTSLISKKKQADICIESVHRNSETNFFCISSYNFVEFLHYIC